MKGVALTTLFFSGFIGVAGCNGHSQAADIRHEQTSQKANTLLDTFDRCISRDPPGKLAQSHVLDAQFDRWVSVEPIELQSHYRASMALFRGDSPLAARTLMRLTNKHQAHGGSQDARVVERIFTDVFNPNTEGDDSSEAKQLHAELLAAWDEHENTLRSLKSFREPAQSLAVLLLDSNTFGDAWMDRCARRELDASLTASERDLINSRLSELGGLELK